MENYQKPKYNKNEVKQELTVLALIVWSPFPTSRITCPPDVAAFEIKFYVKRGQPV